MQRKGNFGPLGLQSLGQSQNAMRMQQNAQYSTSQIGDREAQEIEEENQGFHDYTKIKLKSGHEKCPMWIAPDSRIFLEAFSTQYREATDFLIAIAEPVNRPTYIHEYILTKFSLYAAVSVGLTQNDILNRLKYFAKNEEIPPDVKSEIELYCRQYGKAKLVLKQNKYFIEPNDRFTKSQLMDINSVKQAHQMAIEENVKCEEERKKNMAHDEHMQNLSTDKRLLYQRLMNDIKNGTSTTAKTATSSNIMGQSTVANSINPQQEDLVHRFMNIHEEFKVFIDQENEEANYVEDEDRDDIEMEDISLQRHESTKNKKEELIIEIIPSAIEQVKEECIQRNFPLIEEYDFKHDAMSPELKIEIQAQTQIRAYQEQSLSKMFSNGRARSGVIVLPCGAGKTLTGIIAACTIKKSCIILCQNLVSVEQWKSQFLKFANVGSKIVKLCTNTKDQVPIHIEGQPKEAVILISTYAMISREGKRSADTEKIFKMIQNTDWGLMILDEVQVMPAKMFRTVIKTCKAHCKLGLTATLVREDERIKDLNFLIGPKLYEANWLDLQEQGFLARVQCIEVWCEMTSLFYDQYLKAAPRTKQSLYINNPNKFLSCQYLINLHESRGDKIIVFSDNIYALKFYAQKLKKPYIYGEVSHQERMGILHYFQHTSEINTIFLSTVGDAAIDLPGANVIIQISSHFGARRQEAQRLGRILRPKKESVEKQAFANSQEFNAYFYSLVSTNTQEMFYADKRQQFLVDQGFFFEVIQSLPFINDPEEKKKLFMNDIHEQTNLLNEILRNQNSTDRADKEEYYDDEDQRELDNIRREEKGSLFNGADDDTYD